MTKYKEILNLKAMLEKANIPFTFDNDFFQLKDKEEYFKKIGEIDYYDERIIAYQIVIYSKDGVRLCDSIEHYGSYGNEDDLLEIKGGLTEEENEGSCVLGWLTAEEVFKRFKYCYENDTDTYKEKEMTNEINNKYQMALNNVRIAPSFMGGNPKYMADMNSKIPFEEDIAVLQELVKENEKLLAIALKQDNALTSISETLVDLSKQHISMLQAKEEIIKAIDCLSIEEESFLLEKR